MTKQGQGNIFTTVALNWTMKEFEADGGLKKFTERVASTLEVPAWRIKPVNVYEGSVIIEFLVLPDIYA